MKRGTVYFQEIEYVGELEKNGYFDKNKEQARSEENEGWINAMY
jgi:hypothetical protein